MKKKLLLLVLLMLLICSGCGNKKENKDEMELANSVMITDSNNKSAIFDVSGKQISDFIYSNAKEFSSGVARVKNDAGDYGIVKENGKMLIDFGKYTFIDQYGSFFAAIRDGKHYLLDYKGKEIEEITTSSHMQCGADYIVILHDEELKLFNKEGKAILSVDYQDDSDKIVNYTDEYLSIFIDKKGYLINKNDDKLEFSYESDTGYNISTVEDKNVVLRSASGSYYYNYLYVKDGKEMFRKTINACSGLASKNGILLCNGNSVVSDDGNIKEISDNKNAQFIDYNNFVVEHDGSFNGVDFYIDDKLVKTVNENCIIPEREQSLLGIYRMRTYSSRSCPSGMNYFYYNKNGEMLFGKGFYKGNPFDDAEHAIVSDDGKLYYLIDKDGKQIGDKYSDITTLKYGYYKVKNSDGLYNVMDQNGKLLFSNYYKYSDINKSIGNIMFIKMKTADGITDLYLPGIDKLITGLDEVYVERNYILSRNDDTNTYYSLLGNKLTTVSR